MKKGNCNKIKLVKLLEILRRESDELHAIETPALLSMLESEGILCDRRTLYHDIEVLRRTA